MGGYCIRKILKSKGGSLLQVLLGSTAIAGMALIGLELSRDQKRLAQKTSAVYEMKYLEDEIKYLLEDKRNCWANFGDLLANGNLDFKLDYLISLSRDELTGRDKQIVRMKTLEADGSLMGQENIYIKKYRVTNFKSMDEIRASGSFILAVDIVHRDKKGVEKLYNRSIPIYFKLRQELGGLGECSTVHEQGIVINDWSSNYDGGLNYLSGRLSVGGIVPKADFYVEGGIILNDGESLTCQAKDIGTFRYDKEAKSFDLCDGLKWIALGKESDRFAKHIEYKLDLKGKTRSNLETAEHQICVITRLKKNNSKAECKLKKLSDGQKSRFDIVSLANNLKTEIVCEVWCFD